jgi:integrase
MTDRKTFTVEGDAISFHDTIIEQLETFGKQNIPKDKVTLLKEVESYIERLKPFNKSLKDAVDHYVTFLGDEILRQSKPFISELVDKWRSYKLSDTTLSPKTITELKSYSRFIKWKLGKLKPDELKKNEIDLLIKGLNVSNTTRKKYLTMLRMFIGWIKDEGFLITNPTDGLYFKPEKPRKLFYTSDKISEFLKYVVENDKRLVGYYSLLIFEGLRPSEGSRITWSDINLETKQIYINDFGKTGQRFITIEPITIEWLKWFRENTDKDSPFLPKKNMENLEKKIRKNTFKDGWIKDGFRHGFATYHKSKFNNIHLLEDIMGNSVDEIKQHYSQTIDKVELNKFWLLSPSVVLK